MNRPLLAALLLVASWAHADEPATWSERMAYRISPELRRISERIMAFDSELSTLPAPAGMRTGTRIGYESGREAQESDLWVEITFPKPTPADSVVIVPVVMKSGTGSVPGFGFPHRFKVEVFDENGAAHLLLDKSSEDFPNPTIYPIITHFTRLAMSRVRFTVLKPWASSGPSVMALLALSQILVLDGNLNVAPQGKVLAGSQRDAAPSWSRNNLVNMNMPLGLPVAPLNPPAPLLGYHSEATEDGNEEKSVTVELPAVAALDEIRLVPVRRFELPSWASYGFPLRFSVQTALQPDFSDAKMIFDHTSSTFPVPGHNLVCFQAGGVSARYVRVTATQLWERSGDYLLALAELQAYAGGTNAALGGKVTATDSIESKEWSASALTDNIADGGRILELPEWFRMLDRRREIERELSVLVQRRTHLAETLQRAIFDTTVGGTGTITALTVLLLFNQNRLRRRERRLIRERLARDLHDEIGSNLSSIALISTAATQPTATVEKMRNDFAEIELIARETTESMHDIVSIIGGMRGASKNWLVVLSELADRMLHGAELERVFPSAPLPVEPDIETQQQLYLFCKEVMHNAMEHGHPTHVRFEIAPTAAGGLQFEISDNGVGFDCNASSKGFGLGNLQKRAETMRAHLDIQSIPGTGTTVRLDLPRTRLWHRT